MGVEGGTQQTAGVDVSRQPCLSLRSRGNIANSFVEAGVDGWMGDGGGRGVRDTETACPALPVTPPVSTTHSRRSSSLVAARCGELRHDRAEPITALLRLVTAIKDML